jgi:hypothetical protein
VNKRTKDWKAKTQKRVSDKTLNVSRLCHFPERAKGTNTCRSFRAFADFLRNDKRERKKKKVLGVRVLHFKFKPDPTSPSLDPPQCLLNVFPLLARYLLLTLHSNLRHAQQAFKAGQHQRQAGGVQRRGKLLRTRALFFFFISTFPLPFLCICQMPRPTFRCNIHSRQMKG